MAMVAADCRRIRLYNRRHRQWLEYAIDMDGRPQQFAQNLECFGRRHDIADPVRRTALRVGRIYGELLMSRLTFGVATETLRLAHPFRISGYVFESFDVVVVTLRDGHYQGRGEGGGVYFLGDDAPHMLAALDAARDAIESGPTRDDLRAIMPPGGARNAVDCALWDLEAARQGVPVWQLAGQPSPHPLRTTFTLGADAPEIMAEAARRYVQARAIKVKLTGELETDLARVRAIRATRGDV